MRHSIIKKLEKLSPCSEAVDFARGFKTAQQAWDNCDRGDWMLWLLGKLSGERENKSRKKLVLTACKCARLSLKYVNKNEKRPLKAIQAAEKWAKGGNATTLEEVRNAYAATNAAAYAAYAAADVADAAADVADVADAATCAANAAAYAAYAACAAYAAADAAYAANAAAYAAYAAAYAADAAAYAADAAAYVAAYAANAAAYVAADVAAEIKTLKKCAGIVRKDYPKAPRIFIQPVRPAGFRGK